jgi:hypothetical protein
MKPIAMITCGATDVEIHIVLTSPLEGSEWSTSRSSRLNTIERVPGTHWIGDCMGPRSGRDDMKKGKFLTASGFELRSRNQLLRCPGDLLSYADGTE